MKNWQDGYLSFYVTTGREATLVVLKSKETSGYTMNFWPKPKLKTFKALLWTKFVLVIFDSAMNNSTTFGHSNSCNIVIRVLSIFNIRSFDCFSIWITSSTDLLAIKTSNLNYGIKFNWLILEPYVTNTIKLAQLVESKLDILQLMKLIYKQAKRLLSSTACLEIGYALLKEIFYSPNM